MSNNIGLDIGSRTIKLVVCENGAVVLTRKALTSHDPPTVCRELLGNIPEGPIFATSYGRYLDDEMSSIAVSGKETGPLVVILKDSSSVIWRRKIKCELMGAVCLDKSFTL